MDLVKLAVVLFCMLNIPTTNAERDAHGLVANMELLKAKIIKIEKRNADQDAKLASIEEQNWELKNTNLKLEEKSSELEQELIKIQNELDGPAEAFDCYRTSTLAVSSIIPFEYCSVLTVTGFPLDGTFEVSKAGIYRFTFTGDVSLPSSESDPWGFVFLKVDGSQVASALLDPEYVHGNFTASYGTAIMISLNTIQQLEAGQVVSIEWHGINGAQLYSSSNKYVHFTGQLLR